MEHFKFKLLPLFLVYFFSFSTQINCQWLATIPKFEATTTEENYYLPIDNQTSELKAGDVVECEVTKTKSLKSNDSEIHVFTQAGTATSAYVFYPISKDKKYFSFQIRTKKFPYIILSTQPRPVQGQRLEVILDYNGNSVIRTKDGKHASSVATPGIVNDIGFSGFWIRWLDNQFLEVGRETENCPFLTYRLPEKFYVDFIGIFSYTVDAEWILHREPKWVQHNETENQTQTETKCKILESGNLEKNRVFENSLQHILNQIKTQHEIFKMSKYRSKDIILEYQQLIKKHFRNAEENQNKIYAANHNYSPLKAKIFNQITIEYFQFFEELQIELSILKEENSDENLIMHYLAKLIQFCYERILHLGKV